MGKLYDRKIEYKAWHWERKKMYDVSHLSFSQNGHTKVTVIGEPNTSFTDDEVELLQYTNNNDKHDKKIYEGYVVRDPETGHVFEVLFRADRFMIERRILDEKNPEYDLADLYPLNEKLEIIGNIFEHRDLLEKIGYTGFGFEKTSKPTN